jgi:hypothetical protein
MTASLTIAYHEAGHAVCAMALGIGIRKLESRLCHFCPRNDPMACWRYAVMALGGPAAERSGRPTIREPVTGCAGARA